MLKQIVTCCFGLLLLAGTNLSWAGTLHCNSPLKFPLQDQKDRDSLIGLNPSHNPIAGEEYQLKNIEINNSTGRVQCFYDKGLVFVTEKNAAELGLDIRAFYNPNGTSGCTGGFDRCRNWNN